MWAVTQLSHFNSQNNNSAAHSSIYVHPRNEVTEFLFSVLRLKISYKVNLFWRYSTFCFHRHFPILYLVCFYMCTYSFLFSHTYEVKKYYFLPRHDGVFCEFFLVNSTKVFWAIWELKVLWVKSKFFDCLI